MPCRSTINTAMWMTYDPPTGTITPDLAWIDGADCATCGSAYAFLEALHVRRARADAVRGPGRPWAERPGERFGVLGPFDADAASLVNDGLKQC